MEIEVPSEISNLVLWTMVVSFFSPVALDFILQSKWTDRIQSLVAFATSGIIGITTAYFSGAFSGVGIVTAVLLAFVVTISAYKGFWKKVAPNLKEATDAQ